MAVKTKYKREELIDICERAFVPQSKWLDRDSCKSQTKLGSCLALLKAGCKYEVMTEETEGTSDGCVTSSGTIWLRFWVHNFTWVEDHDDDEHDGYEHDEVFYIPTEKKLKAVNGGDWY